MNASIPTPLLDSTVQADTGVSTSGVSTSPRSAADESFQSHLANETAKITASVKDTEQSSPDSNVTSQTLESGAEATAKNQDISQAAGSPDVTSDKARPQITGSSAATSDKAQPQATGSAGEDGTVHAVETGAPKAASTISDSEEILIALLSQGDVTQENKVSKYQQSQDVTVPDKAEEENIPLLQTGQPVLATLLDALTESSVQQAVPDKDAGTTLTAANQEYTITSTRQTNVFDLLLNPPEKQVPVEGVIEQWSATYSTNPKQEPDVQSSSRAMNAAPLAAGQPVNEAENSVTITLYQSSAEEDLAARTIPGTASTMIDKGGQHLDANGKYIHSNLPNNSLQTSLAEVQEKAMNAEGQGQQNSPEELLPSEQMKPGETALTRESPFQFLNLDASGRSMFTGQNVPATQGTSIIHLPSGAAIPEETVMDQVITRLTTNSRLESGSIRLKLYPQELGELRMEIEVKQDNIKAHITTQNLQAQEALDRHLPKLREALAMQGMELGEVEITVAAGEQDEGFRFQQNEDRHQLGSLFRNNTSQASYTTAETGEEEVVQIDTATDLQQFSIVA
ncbi:MAG: hypothetical protein CSA32_02680 [Desulfobulbus propionicus]|nr:MAG: hypothetical protein CSA32_02680 [Desulfobulbus propionicus]